jgi:hypothetical protein
MSDMEHLSSTTPRATPFGRRTKAEASQRRPRLRKVRGRARYERVGPGSPTRSVYPSADPCGS